LRIIFYYLTLLIAFPALAMDDRPCHPYSSKEEGSVRTIATSADDYMQFFEDLKNGGDLFCEEWNPEYKFNGNHCCAKRRWGKKRAGRCSAARRKSSFCDEMTSDQTQYRSSLQEGELGDILEYLSKEKDGKGDQAFCEANNGFLAYGKPIIPSLENRIQLRNPGRCTNFGTNKMVSMLEWLGREVGKEHPEKVKVLLGDVSAPRGGCLRGARKGHASHTNGQDADIGFISTRYTQSGQFLGAKEFDPQINWWFLKKIFKNPYACIKVVFLDKRLIQKLFKAAHSNGVLDREWDLFKRFVKHARGHHNHFHVRVGSVAGAVGCPGGRPDDEMVDEQDAEEEHHADTSGSGTD
jgi:murein endopeptidase